LIYTFQAMHADPYTVSLLFLEKERLAESVQGMWRYS
jgi:hypothetical protein